MTDYVATYDHVKRNLFEKPERYFYCQCDGQNFIDHWRSARTQFRKALEEGKREQFQLEDYTQPEGGNGILLVDILSTSINTLSSKTGKREETAGILQPFIMKYEVFRRLFDRYEEGLRRHPDAVPAKTKEYSLFAECLALLAHQGLNLQYLSTLLKLNDAL